MWGEGGQRGLIKVGALTSPHQAGSPGERPLVLANTSDNPKPLLVARKQPSRQAPLAGMGASRRALRLHSAPRHCFCV